MYITHKLRTKTEEKQKRILMVFQIYFVYNGNYSNYLCMASFPKCCLLNKYVCHFYFMLIDTSYYFGEDKGFISSRKPLLP